MSIRRGLTHELKKCMDVRYKYHLLVGYVVWISLLAGISRNVCNRLETQSRKGEKLYDAAFRLRAFRYSFASIFSLLCNTGGSSMSFSLAMDGRTDDIPNLIHDHGRVVLSFFFPFSFHLQCHFYQPGKGRRGEKEGLFPSLHTRSLYLSIDRSVDQLALI